MTGKSSDKRFEPRHVADISEIHQSLYTEGSIPDEIASSSLISTLHPLFPNSLRQSENRPTT
jgi:hypothetical protein